MLVNGATKSFVPENRRPDRKLPSDRSAHIDHNLVETAAEALYEFVFSGCDRLDGKHRWADCDEETKVGFRREASAVLEAVLPVLLLREIKSSQIERTAKPRLHSISSRSNITSEATLAQDHASPELTSNEDSLIELSSLGLATGAWSGCRRRRICAPARRHRGLHARWRDLHRRPRRHLRTQSPHARRSS